MTTRTRRYPASAAALGQSPPMSSAASTMVIDDLYCRVDDADHLITALRSEHAALSSTIAAMGSERHCRRDNVEATFAQVGQLLGVTESLSGKFSRLEGKLHESLQQSDVAAHMARHRHDQYEAADRERTEIVTAVHNLLGNFRAEMVAVQESTNQKIDAMRRDVASLQQRAAEDDLRDGEQNHAVAQLQQTTVAMSRRLSDVEASIADVRLGMAKVDGDQKLHVEQVKGEICEMIHREVDGAKHDAAQHADRAEEHTMRRLEDDAAVAAAHHEAAADRTASRFDELQARHGDIVAAVEAVASRVEGQQTLLDDQSATVVRGLETAERDAGECRAAAAAVRDRVEALDADVAQRLLEIIDDQKRFDEGLGLRHYVTDAAVDAERTAAAVSNEISAAIAEASAATHRVEQACTSIIIERSSAVAQDLAALRAECDARHTRLVESTHQALERVSVAGDATAAVSAVRQELGALREAVHTHQVALESTRLDGGGFAEFKDWIKDIEQRMASRGDVEHNAAAFSAQVAALKQAAQNAESVWAQRLESERSAREYEAGSLRSQLQRLQTSGYRGMSPGGATASP
jgi:hypothetical protein